jgi:hypothetical protein
MNYEPYAISVIMTQIVIFDGRIHEPADAGFMNFDPHAMACV